MLAAFICVSRVLIYELDFLPQFSLQVFVFVFSFYQSFDLFAIKLLVVFLESTLFGNLKSLWQL